MHLDKEPDAQQVLEAIEAAQKQRGSPFDEVVFCGFGEPTLKLNTVLEVAKGLKGKNVRVRLNTNGHGNLIYGRSIVPDLVNLIDEISVSLNATNEEDYLKIVKPKWGKETFKKVIEFINEAKEQFPKVIITAVNFPGFDEEAFKKFVKDFLGLKCRIRAFNQEGD